eukprot:12098-Heterococcus_DN1.PRE.1
MRILVDNSPARGDALISLYTASSIGNTRSVAVTLSTVQPVASTGTAYCRLCSFTQARQSGLGAAVLFHCDMCGWHTTSRYDKLIVLQTIRFSATIFTVFCRALFAYLRVSCCHDSSIAPWIEQKAHMVAKKHYRCMNSRDVVHI